MLMREDVHLEEEDVKHILLERKKTKHWRVKLRKSLIGK
jgi:hypothetical protein